jgi:hypothetical protein
MPLMNCNLIMAWVIKYLSRTPSELQNFDALNLVPQKSVINISLLNIFGFFPYPCSWTTDAVLWNPYLQMEACYRDFVCVENAKVINNHILSEVKLPRHVSVFLILTAGLMMHQTIHTRQFSQQSAYWKIASKMVLSTFPLSFSNKVPC